MTATADRVQTFLRNPYTVPYRRITEDKSIKFIPIGLKSAEFLMNDLQTKTVSLVTGIPKEGKSTFLHRLALNAVNKKFRVLLVDGEHEQEFLLNKLYQMVIGNKPNSYDRVMFNKKEIFEPKPRILDQIREWHKDNLLIMSKYLMPPTEDLESLYQLVEGTIKSQKIDLLIFDNLMTLVEGTSVEKLENQARFMKKATKLAKAANCHICVVAHPNKGAKPGEDMGIYDVLGTSDIVNLVDFLIQIKRNYKKESPIDADGYFRLLLNRPYGDVGNIPLRLDRQTRSLFEMKPNGSPMLYDFDLWEKGEQSSILDDIPF